MNMLSLPSVVTFSDGSTITYYYDAEGNKVRVIYSITGKTSLQRNYSNEVIYDNGSQQRLITEEGYIALQENNKYYYYLKDHQGNNRVVVDEDENFVEVNHYYPFGGIFEPTGNVQPYKYNGKELDTKNGLNWYDYGARHYDAALGRWLVVDPLAEKYLADTPYAYCGGNPINRIDPLGMDWYKDSCGNLFWQEGHKNIDGYTNIGSTVTIDRGENIFFNYYQNMGILGDKPANAIEQIASSPYLMQQAFSESSGLSLQSQQDLFAAIQSRSKAELGREAGLFFVGELAGGFIGKTLCWTLGKAAGWIAGKFIGAADNVIAPVVKGYTKSNLKLGQQMHKMYKINEVVEGVAVKEYGKIKGIRPDFVDFRTNTIYELKPNNPRAIKQGWKQLHKYQQMFQQEYGSN